MLGKLFGGHAQSKGAPPPSSLRPPAAPRDSDAAVEFVDSRWLASLPIDPFIEILLHLDPTAIFRCAGVCKPWRRAIIGNASILGPHLDRFLGPSLLLGVFHYDRTSAFLQRTQGPFRSILPSPSDAGGSGGGDDETPANSLMPSAASAGLPELLSSRDGFILLTARSANSLCLCNPITGYCTIVPAAAGKHCKYILLTAGGSSDSDPAVEILAVHRWEEASIMYVDDELTLAYQLFSTSGGKAWAWGSVVQCSGDHRQEPGRRRRLCVRVDRRSTAVGRGAVYWLAGHGLEVTCVLGLDVRTGRTWTTELPKQCHLPILGMSGDGRLYLVRPSSYLGSHIKVWVLPGDSGDSGRWVQQRSISIDIDNRLPSGVSRCQMTIDSSLPPYLSTFCPRSRCVVAQWADQELLIDIDDSSASSQRVRRIGKRKENHCHCCPYEMECSSTYISKMKQF